MDAVVAQDQQELVARLTEARVKLDALAGDLRGVDAELESLATARKQHRLLQDACGVLEAL